MKNEKVKSTTVRFTDSDLHLIVRLQEKLGLGMIHIIRLAIRRFAESENLLPSSFRNLKITPRMSEVDGSSLFCEFVVP